MYHNGQWGTICDKNWSKEDADVVCKELGYKTALFPVKNAKFGEGSGPVRFKHSSISPKPRSQRFSHGNEVDQSLAALRGLCPNFGNSL